ncbi:hypothetical protein LP420_28645 [Massilia sp. B-10]|nr:hypothetical protein LP420_28645 [Massilia sp. B-10]
MFWIGDTGGGGCCTFTSTGGMNGGGGAFISGGGGGGGTSFGGGGLTSSMILVSTASAIFVTMRVPETADEAPDHQRVNQDDSCNASEILPGLLLMRKIHACFLQYQLFL